MTLETTAGGLLRHFALYYLKDAAGVTQFMGIDRLAQIFALQSARRIPEFDNIFPPTAPIKIEIVFQGTMVECRNTLYRVAQTYGTPPLNRAGLSIMIGSGKNTRVQCNETGEIFNTISEASAALGMAASAISNNINAKPGCRTVKGKTFKRV